MKSFFKGVLFLVILLIMVELYLYIMVPNKDNYKKFGVYNVATYELMSEKVDTIDVIFLGDSLIYSDISPMIIWNEYGYTTFDCAGPSLTMKNSYEYLKVAIDSQHPKMVLFEADVMFRKQELRDYKIRDMKRIFNYVPLSRFHNSWKKFLSLESNKTKWINVEKGYKYITKLSAMKQDNDNMKETNELKAIAKGTLDYFEKIKKLCDDNNIKLVLIGNPSKRSWSYSKILTINKIAKDYDLEFVDMNTDNPTNIDWISDTKDKGIHLNYKGAKKVSKYIGNYLKETSLLEDHRNDEKYKDWHIAYQKYLKNHAKYETNATE